jgi:peptidoglycan/LPS O-acetylase OafA/YrhL
VVYSLPFTHLDAFALGALLTSIRIPKARPIFLASIVALPLLGLFTDFLATAQWKDASLFSLGFPVALPYGYKFLWGYSLINGLFAILIYGVARLGWASRLLEWRPLRYLGKISYGLYVYHFALVWLTATLSDHKITDVFPPLLALLTFAIVCAVASLSYHLMEKPLIDLKDRFFAVPDKRVALDIGPCA